MLPGMVCILAAVVVILLIKLRLLHRGMDEVGEQFRERLAEDTNTLISVSSGDRHLRRFAASTNRELRTLRTQRRRYLDGDRELKEAVANLSHDLRTPLTAVSGYLELLKREEKSAAADQYLAYISNRTEAMKQLTEELFRYTVIRSADSLTLAEADVKGILEESMLGFFGALGERGIEPVIRMPDRKVIRRVDAAALARVFGNIISNALKYSDGDLYVELSESGLVTFRNHASGLDQTSVGRLFHRFYTVEAGRGATGLGLAIAKTLVGQMGGSIAAEYEDGCLTVIVELG